MIQPSGISPNLSVLPGGIIPPNPTELLARQSLEDAVEILKQDYDYIVLDTAPIGMVTDTQLIARVADASIYVCRADYTHKNDYQLINELYNNNRLPNLCTVINGLDMKRRNTAITTATASMASTMVTARNMATVMDTAMAAPPTVNSIYPISPGYFYMKYCPRLRAYICLFVGTLRR